jgi:hypothetical protein
VATNQTVAHLDRATWAIPFPALSKHEGAFDPLFFDLEADDILLCKCFFMALVTPSRLKLRPDNLSGVETVCSTLETPRECRQGALHDRYALNSGKKGCGG